MMWLLHSVKSISSRTSSTHLSLFSLPHLRRSLPVFLRACGSLRSFHPFQAASETCSHSLTTVINRTLRSEKERRSVSQNITTLRETATCTTQSPSASWLPLLVRNIFFMSSHAK